VQSPGSASCYLSVCPSYEAGLELGSCNTVAVAMCTLALNFCGDLASGSLITTSFPVISFPVHLFVYWVGLEMVGWSLAIKQMKTTAQGAWIIIFVDIN